jgi:hypothetical protein
MSRQSVRLMIDPLGLLFPVWTSSKPKAKRGGVAAESAVHGPIHWSEAVGAEVETLMARSILEGLGNSSSDIPTYEIGCCVELDIVCLLEVFV